VKQYRGVAVIFALFALATFTVEGMRPTQAMPPFAQAYGENCNTCHSTVPALNAYGRYVQRTGYASLDASIIHRVNPFWVGEQVTYNTRDANFPNKIVLSNVSLHAAGLLGNDFTFHLHEWFVNDGEPGFTDTLWIGYNNLFHRDGHIVLGKIEPPGPSPFSQWFDLSGFATPEIVVGEHAYALDGNRWGTKLTYVHDWLVADVAYLGPSGDLNTATAFDATSDRTFQWRAAYARPDRPIEAGVYGSTGSFPISDGTFDRYNSAAAYVQIDPQNYVPGVLTIYQVAYDPDPAAGAPATRSKAFTSEIYERLFDNRGMLGLRNEVTDNGMGTVTHSGNVDFELVIMRRITQRGAHGLFLSGEEGLTQGSTPGWKAQLGYYTTFAQ